MAVVLGDANCLLGDGVLKSVLESGIHWLQGIQRLGG